MTGPRTVAGQDLLHDLNFDPHQRQRLKSSILAIEAEAAAPVVGLDESRHSLVADAFQAGWEAHAAKADFEESWRAVEALMEADTSGMVRAIRRFTDPDSTP